MSGKRVSACAGVLGLLLVSQPAWAQSPIVTNDYAKTENWLCLPGKMGDACSSDLTTTVIKGDGSTTVEMFTANPQASIDCFYVYPTVSKDPSAVSDMTPNAEELAVVRRQFARFGSKCRLYAPVYRQTTLAAFAVTNIGKPLDGSDGLDVRSVGYADVQNAWDYYLAHENKDRGVVLVGHGQGARLLAQLIAHEIDGKPAAQRIVSAILTGVNLLVYKSDNDPPFKSLPSCGPGRAVGCLINYASFRETLPPPATSRFGGAPDNRHVVLCVNPTGPGGDLRGQLQAYLPTDRAAFGAPVRISEWIKGQPNPTTPFVSVPGLLRAECVKKNGFSYLEVRVTAKPGDRRADDIPGDVILPGGQVATEWGLHHVDLDLALGNLVETVGNQAREWRWATSDKANHERRVQQLRDHLYER